MTSTEPWALESKNASAVIRRELQHFDGREGKTTGDGFLATFDGPARAIRCALACTPPVRSRQRRRREEGRHGSRAAEEELFDRI